MAATIEAKSYRDHTDQSLVYGLKDAGEDVRISTQALKWAGGVAVFGEAVRGVLPDSTFAKRLQVGTRIAALVVGVGGFITREVSKARESSIADEIATRYEQSGHESLLEAVDGMDKSRSSQVVIRKFTEIMRRRVQAGG